MQSATWLTNQVGERPLKHWKAINVFEIKGDMSVWKKCTIGGENGEQDILLANIPPSVQEFLNTIKDRADAIEKEEASIEQEEARINKAKAAETADNTSDNSALVKIQGFNRQLISDEDRLIERQQALAKAKEDYRATLTQAGDKTLALAMFTGSKYNGLEIWDCGKR